MNTAGILKPNELPFPVSDVLANSINELIAALDRDDDMLDAYLDDVESSARDTNAEHDRWIRDYYVYFGWRHDKYN